VRAVSREHHVSVRRQLAAGLEAAIRDGHIRPGAPLPSTRDLAARTGLHRSTVSAAYTRLRRRGWTTGGPGARLRVRASPLADTAAPTVGRAETIATDGLRRILSHAVRSGIDRTETLRALGTLVAHPDDGAHGGLPVGVRLFDPRPGLRAALAAELRIRVGIPVTEMGRIPGSGAPLDTPLLARAEVVGRLEARRPPLAIDRVPLQLSGGTRERGFARRTVRGGLVTLVSVSRTIHRFAEELAARDFDRGVSFVAIHPAERPALVRAIAASRLVLFDEPSRERLPPTDAPSRPIRLLSEARVESLRAYLGSPPRARPGT
jgi:DNA-binding transcriptional regulator YhcF (GntR family)